MNVVTPKSQKGSPKTPGGISKSLLTPCRRVGLSKKWRKSGCSSFISPLSAHTPDTPERTEIREEKKRKKCHDNEYNTDENNQNTRELDEHPASNVCSPASSNNCNEHKNITLTPRNSEIPRKKSKVLSISLKKSQETDKDDVPHETELQTDVLWKEDSCKINELNLVRNKMISTPVKELKDTEIVIDKAKPLSSSSKENVKKLVRTESRSKKLSLKRSLSKGESKDTTKIQQCETNDSLNINPKEKSPNNLTKECIVVIQKKIFKSDTHTTSNKTENIKHLSDSEPDVPLSTLKQENNVNVTLNTLDDDDFISKPVKKKRNLSIIKKNKTSNPIDSSQSSQEESEKRTILVKKTYDKVIKPQKAKSTGSITQKDIDELKARIEMKKKRLLAKSMSIDTEELRGLIKKWQKGCQEALMELLDLMKRKLPDRQNMDYAEMLEALKIPAQLVGYDSENDCFITPDDNNVLLSALKL